jgi:hypothetical protein
MVPPGKGLVVALAKTVNCWICGSKAIAFYLYKGGAISGIPALLSKMRAQLGTKS